jgi:hypothetical protein
MESLDLSKSNLKKFGFAFGLVFIALAVFVFIRHKQITLPFIFASVTFFAFAITAPGLLKIIYIPWMKLVFIIGWINTRIILIIIFYLLLTPIALLMRLLGHDFLDRKMKNGKDSYWVKKENNGFPAASYERQY